MVIRNLRNIQKAQQLIRLGRKVVPIITGIGTATSTEAALEKATEVLKNVAEGGTPPIIPNVEVLEAEVKQPEEVTVDNWKTITTSLPSAIFINVIGRPVSAIARGTAEGIYGILHGFYCGATLKKDVAVNYSNTALDPNNNVLLLVSQEIGSGKYIITGELITFIKVMMVKGIIIIAVTIIAVKAVNRAYPYITKKIIFIERQRRVLAKENKKPNRNKNKKNITENSILDI